MIFFYFFAMILQNHWNGKNLLSTNGEDGALGLAHESHIRHKNSSSDNLTRTNNNSRESDFGKKKNIRKISNKKVGFCLLRFTLLFRPLKSDDILLL